MTDDIVKQLRDYDVDCYGCTEWNPPCYSPDTCKCDCHKGLPALAADEIERLRGLVKDLQTALGPFPLAVNIQCDNPSEVAAHVIDAWKKAERRD